MARPLFAFPVMDHNGCGRSGLWHCGCSNLPEDQARIVTVYRHGRDSAGQIKDGRCRHQAGAACVFYLVQENTSKEGEEADAFSTALFKHIHINGSGNMVIAFQPLWNGAAPIHPAAMDHGYHNPFDTGWGHGARIDWKDYYQQRHGLIEMLEFLARILNARH